MTIAPVRSPYSCPVCGVQVALLGEIGGQPTETMDPLLLHELALAGLMQHLKAEHPTHWQGVAMLLPIDDILDDLLSELGEQGYSFNGLLNVDGNAN